MEQLSTHPHACLPLQNIIISTSHSFNHHQSIIALLPLPKEVLSSTQLVLYRRSQNCLTALNRVVSLKLQPVKIPQKLPFHHNVRSAIPYHHHAPTDDHHSLHRYRQQHEQHHSPQPLLNLPIQRLIPHPPNPHPPFQHHHLRHPRRPSLPQRHTRRRMGLPQQSERPRCSGHELRVFQPRW